MSVAPRVSAIVIFFNEARFIAESIESVLAQDFSDWELILVDDGSSDESTRIALDYAARHPQRIHYLDHPQHANRGMSASRNLGLTRARGEYIAFLDADDIWLPRKLSEQSAILDAHPEVDMVYGRTLLWHSWRHGDSSRDEFCELGFPPDSVIRPPALLVSLIENRAQTPTTCNAMIRRCAVARIGGFEASFRGMFEDQVLFMKLSAESCVYVASRTWAHYRQRADSCSARSEASGEVREAKLRLLHWLEAYLRVRKLHSQQVWQMLRKQQRAARWPVLQAIHSRYAGLKRLLS